ncbi:hypothetical protein GCM10010182_60270 [Actinomadura cremea]|nr:hypothetical protein GCM10010182_60270 [Actinomadura cremea]
MSLEHFNPLLRSNDLVQDLKWDAGLKERFLRDEASVLDEYALLPEERRAIADRDFKRLYLIGLHPYLLGQLSRVIHGNAERAGSSLAATALVASLLGEDAAARGVRSTGRAEPSGGAAR